MIDLYYWTTPNGHKITVFLEEAGLEYRLNPVNITRGEQFQEEYLKISPNNKIPAIVDWNPADNNGPLAVFESGAILQYLADKTGRFCPKDLRGRTEVRKWLIWQVANLGPMSGQHHYFSQFADEKIPQAIKRYEDQTRHLYEVLNRQLRGKEYVTGAQYTIADMAIYPWAVSDERQIVNGNFPEVQRWHDRMMSRPAVQRAYRKAEKINSNPQIDEEGKKALFKSAR